MASHPSPRPPPHPVVPLLNGSALYILGWWGSLTWPLDLMNQGQYGVLTDYTFQCSRPETNRSVRRKYQKHMTKEKQNKKALTLQNKI